MKKRLISIFLAFCLLLTLFPTALAWEVAPAETWEATPDTGSSETSEESEGALLAGDIVASGQCGPNSTWTLDSEGMLTINGTGRMTNFDVFGPSILPPWFDNRGSVKIVHIQNGITSIGNYAFYSCEWLTDVTIPESVTRVGDSAFSSCIRLPHIIIPSSVEVLNSFVFSQCEALMNIVVQDGNARYSSKDGVVFDKGGKKLEIFPCGRDGNYAIPSGTTSIGYHAFYRCDKLNSIIIPDSVTSIGDSAFAHCSKLTSVTIPNSVTSIGDMVFSNCSKLTSVTIPDSVRSIGDSAFANCSKLTSVTIPDSIASIGDMVFADCIKLTSVTIPDSVTSIELRAFRNCNNLKDVYYIGSEARWNAISIEKFGNDSLLSATIHYNSTGGGGNNLPEIQTSGYYKTPESRLFRVRAKDISYPMPAGFAIAANGQTFSTGQETCTSTDDIHVSVPGDYGGDFLITKTGYHDYAIPAALTGEYNSVVMTPVSVTAPFVQALLLDHTQGAYTRYYNLLSEAGNVFELDISGKEQAEMSALYPAVNWNGHGAGQIWLEQGEVRIALSNNALNEVCLPEKFTASADIYLCGEAADGATFRQKTKLRILKRLSSELPLDFGESIQIDLTEADNENADILWQSGEKLEIDFGKLLDTFPISFNIKEDGTVEGVLGIELPEKGVTQGVYGAMKGSLARLAALEGDDVAQSEQVASLAKELKKNGVFLMESVNTFGIKGKVRFLGYLTGKIINGAFTFTEFRLAMIFSGSLNYNYYTVLPVVSIPAYFKSSLAAKIQGVWKWVQNNDTGTLQRENKNNQTDKVSISLSVEAGPGWDGFVSGGIKGSGALKISLPVPIQSVNTTFSLEGSIAFVGTLKGISGEWTVVSGEHIFWDGSLYNPWCWREVSSEQENASLQAVFEPNLAAAPMRMIGESERIAESVSGYNAPCVACLPDGRLLAVWVADVPGRNAVDKSGVYYSLYANGAWSAPALVSEDGTNDSAPKLHQENGTLSLAWQNYSTVYHTDTLPTLDEISAQISTVCSAFDANTETWSNPVSGSPTWYDAETELPDDYDGASPHNLSAMQFLQYDSLRALLYTAEDTDKTVQVYGLFDDGNGWGSPLRLTEIPDGVNGFGACINDESLCILYTKGEYANSALNLCVIRPDADLTVVDTDYVRQTLSPENPLSVSLTLKNNSPLTIEGVRVSVQGGSGETYQEDIQRIFRAGEEDTLSVNYPLPSALDFSQLRITAHPLQAEDANPSDNSASCDLYLTDLSVEEVSALTVQGTTRILTQVVNRGQTQSGETTLIVHKDTSDGDTLTATPIPAMLPGEMRNITVDVNGISPGDMVYVEAAELTNENLIGNNSSQAVVTEMVEIETLKEASEYTVTFSGEGGTVSVLTMRTQNGRLSQLPIPHRDNYRFDGWFTSQTGGLPVTAYTLFEQDSTLYAHWTYLEVSEGTNRSGGSSTPYRYYVTIPDNLIGGTVEASSVRAKFGASVVLTVQAHENYALDILTVRGLRNREITLKNQGNGKYSFSMPASDVHVEVSFRPSNVQEPLITPSNKNPIHFTDVFDGSYYYDAVMWAANSKITNGKTSTTFEPESICNRANAVTFLWRLAGSPLPMSDSNPFVDVPTSEYYYNAVLWAVEQGITKGITSQMFVPEGICTRAQIVTFLYRSVKSPISTTINAFTDVPRNIYFSGAVNWASETGVTQGYTRTTFGPYEYCNRGQIVTFLYRHFLYQHLKTSAP